jgi:hypothetical protein
MAVEGEISMPRKMQAVVPEGSILSPTSYSVYINETAQHQVFIWDNLFKLQVMKRVVRFSIELQEVRLAVVEE